MKLINLIIGVLLLTGMAMADNVVVHVNYPDDVFYTGATNMIQIWIENDVPIISLSLGFEFSGYSGQVEWVLDYGVGSSEPVVFEGPLSSFFEIEVANPLSMDDGTLYDSLAIGAAALTAKQLEAGLSRKCITLLLKIPAGEPTGQICIDNVWLPPGIAWAFTEAGTYDEYAPNYHGCVNSAPDNPDCPAICFSVEEPTFMCGDVDNDSDVNISDITMMINTIFNGTPMNNSVVSADVDCSGRFNIADPAYLIGYYFAGGDVPCTLCP